MPGIERTIIDNFFLIKNESYIELLNQNNNFTISFDKFRKLNQKAIKINSYKIISNLFL